MGSIATLILNTRVVCALLLCILAPIYNVLVSTLYSSSVTSPAPGCESRELPCDSDSPAQCV